MDDAMRRVAGVATLAIMPVLSGPDPIHLPSLLRMSDAVAAGLTADQVRQRVRSGRWQAMARGTYLRHAIDGDDPFEVARTEHAVRARAATMTHAASVIALGSAAAVHALPTVSAVPQHVHLISEFGRAGVRAGVNIHRLPLEPADIDVSGGPVTTVIRTWTDITRRGSLADSLAFADAAFRRGLLDGSHLVELAETATGRGARRVRVAASLVDPRRETPLESWSAACFHTWRLPAAEPQVVILDASGRFIARVDFLWKEFRVIGEADGRLKYDGPRSLYEEKRREDRLRGAGYRVVRWGWSDLGTPEALRDRLRRLFDQSGHTARGV